MGLKNTPLLRYMLLVLLLLGSSACSTGTWLKLPEDSSLIIDERPERHSQGRISTRPYTWRAAGGIPYRVVDAHSTTLRQGHLNSRFRVPSLFWPPAAIAYWPLGFGQKCYDLTEEVPQTCTYEDFRQLRLAHRMRR